MKGTPPVQPCMRTTWLVVSKPFLPLFYTTSTEFRVGNSIPSISRRYLVALLQWALKIAETATIT